MIRLSILLILLSSCSLMEFKKGKYKGKNAYKCIDDNKYYFLIEDNELYKVGKKIYTTKEQFKTFNELNNKDKEEFLYYLKDQGRINSFLYKFSTVDIEIPEKHKIKINH